MKRQKGKRRKCVASLANWVYKLLRKSKWEQLIFSKSVLRDVQLLGRAEEEYYVQKLVYVCGFCLGGMMLAGLYIGWSWLEGGVKTTELERPQSYEEAKEVSLKVDGQDALYNIELEPHQLTWEEAAALLKDLLAKWESLLLGENRSMEQIQQNLVLPEYVEGYPFEIYWESSNEQLIDTVGTVYREGVTEDNIVVLTAVFYYQDWMWTEQFAVLVQKEILTEEERYKRALGNFLADSEKKQRMESVWILPETFEGEMLSYHSTTEDYQILLLAGLLPLVGVAIWFGQDQDLRSNKKKRQTELQVEYVSFASSLSMYISAGLNLQAAMKLCAQDYMKRRPKENLLRCALVEFQKDIQNGRGFLEALERFAEFTDDLNYRRLTGLLGQGLVNGAQGLSYTLEQEVDKIREEKRRQCKVSGEQISTALIAPMMLQLGIVIALIMIPAFTGMEF